jgi:chromosome segregation ATPase
MIKPNNLPSPQTLAEEGLRLYRQVEFDKRQTVIDAARCGAHFNGIKAALPHGEFSGWLQDNCPEIKGRTVQDYMRLAREMPQLLDDSNTRHAADLSIRAALAYVAASAEVKAEVDAKLEAGESVTQQEIAELKRRAEAAERKAEDLEKEIEELTRALNETERAFEENRRQVNALVEQRTAANAAETDRKVRDLERLNEELRTQRDRMVGDLSKHNAVLEGALKREREERTQAVEAARKQGVDDASDELDRRIAMREERIEQLKEEEDRIKSRISLRLQSDKALKAGKQAMLTFSVEMMEFAEQIHEHQEQTDEAMADQWLKAAEEMEAGTQAVREIALKLIKQPVLTPN